MVIAAGKLEVLDPTFESTTGKVVPIPRLDTFSGKTIGVLWNGRPSGDKILKRMMDILREKHQIKEVMFRDKPYIGNIAPEPIFVELVAKCDAVITGVGD